MSMDHKEHKHHHAPSHERRHQRGAKRRYAMAEPTAKRHKNESGGFKSGALKKKRSTFSVKTKSVKSGKRTMLKGKRRGFRGGRVKGGHYGLGHSTLARPFFSMTPSKAGTMIRRVYETQIYCANTANTFDAAGFCIAIVNSGGTQELRLYLGSVAGGNVLKVFPDFTAEQNHYLDVFRWCKMLGIECELVPIGNVVVNEDAGLVDMSVENDAGLLHLFPWDGDNDIVSSAGVGQLDWTEAQRIKGKNFKPIGDKSCKLAKQPNTTLVIPSTQTGGAAIWSFPPCAALDTVQLRTAGTVSPGFGWQYYWQHPGLNTNSAKVSFIMKVRVLMQWNTLYDADIAASKEAAKQAALANYDPRDGFIQPEEKRKDTMDDAVMVDKDLARQLKAMQLPTLSRGNSANVKPQVNNQQRTMR